MEPHLENPIVQFALDLGMKLCNPKWQSGDPPYLIGRIEPGRIVKGKLSWYQPFGRCHHISYFSMAIGAAIYPELTWRFVSGDLHTVPVGYDDEGNPKVVMDILLFDSRMRLAGSVMLRNACQWNAQNGIRSSAGLSSTSFLRYESLSGME